ncbi:hypothetical protein MW887_004616 [Aspergillus wentii]|nr:hypothetical protein MW887_004616 [Aspergillus wentii]
MSLTILPNELLVIIGKYVLLQEDLNSLARTSTRMYSIFDPILYYREVHKFESDALNYAEEYDTDTDTVCTGWREAPLTCYAAHRGRVDILKILLEHGGSAFREDNKGRTPLYFAFHRRNTEMIQLLLDAGVDVNQEFQYFGHPLYDAAEDGYVEAVKLLVAHPEIDLDYVPYRVHNDPFNSALRNAKKPVEDHARQMFDSPLLVAIEKKHVEVVRILLEAGVDPIGLCGFDGVPVLTVAAGTGNVHIVNMLLQYGVQIQPTLIYNSHNLLVHAAICGHDGVVRLLLKATKIDPQMKTTKDRSTLLHHAARKGGERLINFLLSRGVNLYAINQEGMTAIDMANKYGNNEAESALLENMQEATTFAKEYLWLRGYMYFVPL